MEMSSYWVEEEKKVLADKLVRYMKDSVSMPREVLKKSWVERLARSRRLPLDQLRPNLLKEIIARMAYGDEIPSKYIKKIDLYLESGAVSRYCMNTSGRQPPEIIEILDDMMSSHPHEKRDRSQAAHDIVGPGGGYGGHLPAIEASIAFLITFRSYNIVEFLAALGYSKGANVVTMCLYAFADRLIDELGELDNTGGVGDPPVWKTYTQLRATKILTVLPDSAILSSVLRAKFEVDSASVVIRHEPVSPSRRCASLWNEKLRLINDAAAISDEHECVILSVTPIRFSDDYGQEWTPITEPCLKVKPYENSYHHLHFDLQFMPEFVKKDRYVEYCWEIAWPGGLKEMKTARVRIDAVHAGLVANLLESVSLGLHIIGPSTFPGLKAQPRVFWTDQPFAEGPMFTENSRGAAADEGNTEINIGRVQSWCHVSGVEKLRGAVLIEWKLPRTDPPSRPS